MKTPFLAKHNSRLIPSEMRDTMTFTKALLKRKMEDCRTQRQLVNTKYWIVNRDEHGSIKSLGLDPEKRPLPRTKDLLKDYPDNYFIASISSDLFQDIYKMLDVKDLDMLMKITSKYMGLWSKSTNPDAPVFPVLLIDQNGRYNHFSNSAELKGHDIAHYPWDDVSYLIDRNLNEFHTEYWNFGHPTGVVIPKGIKRSWTKSALLNNLKEEAPEWLK